MKVKNTKLKRVLFICKKRVQMAKDFFEIIWNQESYFSAHIPQATWFVEPYKVSLRKWSSSASFTKIHEKKKNIFVASTLVPGPPSAASMGRRRQWGSICRNTPSTPRIVGVGAVFVVCSCSETGKIYKYSYALKNQLFQRLTTSVADPGCLSRIRIFFHPRSRVKKFRIPDPDQHKRLKAFFNPKIFF